VPEVEEDAKSKALEVTPREKKPTLGAIINIRDFELAAPKLLPPKSFACQCSRNFTPHLLAHLLQTSKPVRKASIPHNGTEIAGRPLGFDLAFYVLLRKFTRQPQFLAMSALCHFSSVLLAAGSSLTPKARCC
jgi:hypothetical protein